MCVEFSNLCPCCCPALSEEERAKKKINDEIEVILKRDRADRERTIKILLLGTGGAGKSTVIKQMRMLHEDDPFSESVRRKLVPHMHSNLVEVLAKLTETTDARADVFEQSSFGDELDRFRGRDFRDYKILTNDELEATYKIWNDAKLQKFITDHKIFFNVEASYLIGRIEDMVKREFLPTSDDVLRVRVRTTGINEYTCETKQTGYKDEIIMRLVDVGGQKTERRKWINCFENVDAVLFIAALSDYDRPLEEDPSVNAMQESLKLFTLIVNDEFEHYFKRSAMILFLNKTDKFRERITRSTFEHHFPDFVGLTVEAEAKVIAKAEAQAKADAKATADSIAKARTESCIEARAKVAEQYISDLYHGCNRNPKRDIYTHYTNALDEEQMRFVMGSVSYFIIKTAIWDVVRF